MAKRTNHRHGDVDIIISDRRTMPKHYKQIYKGNRCVVAEGEATGHSHVVTPLVDGQEVEMWEFGGMRFLTIPEGGAKIVHQEHGEQVIQKGNYQVRIEEDYDPFAQENREVLD